VEAASKTADILKKTADSFGRYKDTFTVTHAAMGSRDGIAYFPKSEVGVESHGLCDENQDKDRLASACDEVPMLTADQYMQQYVDPGGQDLIDILSVDVEGNDWDVLGLGGANRTLSRTKYLEFEYHAVGNWANYDLSMVTSILFQEYGFICYYAGVDKLWRLTNCFQDYFDRHSWSNVACVNPSLNADLALRMESMFQRQLA
jgi:FkbM family methyltransferase